MADEATTTGTAPAAAPTTAAPTTPSLTTPPADGAPQTAPQNAAGGNSTPPPGNSPEVKFPDNWKQGLPKEFQDDPALKVVHDVPTLAKSYIHAQKMIGADKVVIPGKFATEEDWKQVYQKLGLPAELKDYQVAVPKDSPDFNPQFIDKFKEFAHKNGVMPKQAEGLLSWYGETLKSQNADIIKAQETANAQEWDGLKKTWGAAFDNKVLSAQIAFKEFADPETTKFLDDSGLSKNPKLVALFAKIGEATKEDTLQPPGKRTSIGAPLDPKSAREEIGKMMADTKGPYYDKSHPNHKAAVDEMARLNTFAYPQPQKS
jgi:hypothetical protein